MNQLKKAVVDKNDLRRLMKEKTGVGGLSQKKIESQHAKYNAVGELWCTLCNRHVKSNILWNTHLQSRMHRELTRLETGASEVQTASLKRKAYAVGEVLGNEKKVSRVGDTASSVNRNRSLISNLLPSSSMTLEKSNAGLSGELNEEEMSGVSNVCDFDPAASSTNVVVSKLPSDVRVPEHVNSTNEMISTSLADQLPEGFFDDPKMDAKVRQVPYKEKMEEEWELFQKTMKEETMISEALVEEDDELREVERNIEEIDDQLCRWSRVTDLLKKRESFAADVGDRPVGVDDNCESDAGDEFDEFSDWRAGGKRP